MEHRWINRSLILTALLALGVFWLAQPLLAAPAKIDVLIGFSDQPNAGDVARIRAAGGQVRHVYTIVPAVAASVPEAALRGLANERRVRVIEPDGMFHAGLHSDPSFDAELNNTWGVKHIGAGTVHLAGNTGAGIRVAVIDSGVDYHHPDLSGRVAGGYDFANGDSNPMDDNGHGTHVAGTVAATANGVGVVGTAPGVQIYALKVLGANGSGSFSSVIAALDWCVGNGIHVSNNSYGSGSDPGTIVRAAFDNSAAAGVLHIAAAGNSGTANGKGNNVNYPARYSSVVGVAATKADDTRASFSSTGPDVELAAPGVTINSTRLGGGYVEYNGTSMAAPHVAGVAALVFSAGISQASDVRYVLQQTAHDLGAAGRDNHYGYGLVDAVAAAGLVAPPPDANDAPVVTITSPADGSTFTAGDTISFAGSATDLEDGNLTPNLTWVSDRDGVLGTGGSIWASLSKGTHLITASATDSGGLTGYSSVTVWVQSTQPAPAGTVRVAAITYATQGGRANNKDLIVTFSVQNDQNQPVASASLSFTLYRNGAAVGDGSGTTDTAGTASFRLKNAPSGTYTSIVTALDASGYVWNGETPPNSFVK